MKKRNFLLKWEKRANIAYLALCWSIAIVAIAFIVLFYNGCASVSQWDQMSPMQKSIRMVSIYSEQYSDFRTQLGYEQIDGLWEKTKDIDLTDDQSIALEKKKEILLQLWEPMRLYCQMAQYGIEPPLVLEKGLIALFDQLQSLAL